VPTHDRVWLRAVERLMAARGRVDGTFNGGLDARRQYPALLAVWVAGVAAIAAGREDFLARLLTEPTWRPQFNDRTPRPAADVLRPIWLLDHDWLNKLPRWGEPARWLYPASRLLRLEGREPVRSLLPDDEGYAAACDRLECLASYAAVDAAREPSRHARGWVSSSWTAAPTATATAWPPRSRSKSTTIGRCSPRSTGTWNVPGRQPRTP
jgi:hypothetical protein